MSTARKFEFGVEFSSTGEVLRDASVQRVWNAEEVAAARDAAREEGALDEAALAQRQQAEALKAMASQLSLVLGHLTRLTDELRRDAAALALTAARKIAGTAVENYPDAELEALVEACAEELRAAPRLKVTLPAANAEALKPALEQMLEGIGYSGALRVAVSEGVAPGGCALDWEHGAVSSDPAEIAQRIETLVAERLAEAPAPQLDLFAAMGARGAPESER